MTKEALGARVITSSRFECDVLSPILSLNPVLLLILMQILNFVLVETVEVVPDWLVQTLAAGLL